MWLALPMIGMSLSRMLMGFIDFVMVSSLGVNAQAAISPATLLVFAVACLSMGVAQVVQTFVAQADGRGEQARCGAYAWQSFYIAAGWGLATLPLLLTTPLWYGWLGRVAQHPPEVIPLEVEYLSIALWCLAPATVSMGLENFFNGLQRPVIGLVAVVISLCANVAGNYLLIFGPHIVWKVGGLTLVDIDFPDMGIAGAALATVIAWIIRAAVLVVALLHPRIDALYNTRRSFAPDLKLMRDMLTIGGPTGLQWLIDIGAWVIFTQVMIPPLGTAAMAASNIAVQYMHLSFMPALGIGLALASQVGFAIGQGFPEQAAQRLLAARRLIVGYMGLMAIPFCVFGGPLVQLMCYEPDPDTLQRVVALGAGIMIWVAVFQVSDGICITYSFALRGAGDTRVPALLFAFCCWVVFVGGGVAVVKLAPQLGVHGPWMMCTAYILLLGILLWRRFEGGAWRRIRLFDASPDPAQPAP